MHRFQTSGSTYHFPQVQDVEGKLPPKVPVVVKVAMPAYQAALYSWVRKTSTLRLPDWSFLRQRKHVGDWATLTNTFIELKKVRPECLWDAYSVPLTRLVACMSSLPWQSGVCIWLHVWEGG